MSIRSHINFHRREKKMSILIIAISQSATKLPEAQSIRLLLRFNDVAVDREHQWRNAGNR